jgi:hypothetical protein
LTKREKTLAAAAGTVVVALVTYVAVSKVFLEPAANLDRQALDLQDRIARAKAEKGKEDAYKNRLKQLAAGAFGTDEMKVSEQVRTVVTDVLILSGVSSQYLTLKPMTGSRVPGVYREIGWAVRARGKLAQVINFLYLMSREPHLHRVDNVVVHPVPNSQDVELQVKYATLLLESPPTDKLATDEVEPLPIETTLLETPERQQYDVIAVRDVFRPYIPAKPQVAQAPPPPPRREESPPSPKPGSDARWRVVGLPTWFGRSDVLVRDASSGKVTSLTTGDDLAGGKIILVDYRMLPLPKKPEILSGSRVVLLIGSDYYAVELGQSLADKRALTDAELPPGLPRLQRPSPEAPPPSAGTAKE